MASNGNLDRTLDSIAKDRKPTRRNTARRAGAPGAKTTTTTAKGSANGIKKNKAAKPVKAVVPTKRVGESKILVSGLPDDVSDAMLKDYFGTAIAPVKKVLVNYGPNGRSRGSATIAFADSTAAARALADLDGVRVDNRVLRIEVMSSSADIVPAVAVKTLSDRISKPKVANKEKGKPVAGEKGAQVKTNGDAKKDGGRKKKAGRTGRPKAKTVGELDAEMEDYFGPGTAQPAAAAAAPGADTAMADEVL